MTTTDAVSSAQDCFSCRLTGTLTFVGAGSYVLFVGLPANRALASRVPVLGFGIGLISIGIYRWNYYAS
jgi:hypothetical protein